MKPTISLGENTAFHKMNTQSPHQPVLVIPLRFIASRLCGALAVNNNIEPGKADFLD
jgi:hypothetical protein